MLLSVFQSSLSCKARGFPCSPFTGKPERWHAICLTTQTYCHGNHLPEFLREAEWMPGIAASPDAWLQRVMAERHDLPLLADVALMAILSYG